MLLDCQWLSRTCRHTTVLKSGYLVRENYPRAERNVWHVFKVNKTNNCKKLKFKIECKGQIYKTAEIILLCHKVLCFFLYCDFYKRAHSEKT